MGVEYSGKTWIVKGYRELGDNYPYYYVNYLPKSQKYFCTCFLNRYGKIRKKDLHTYRCSNIMQKDTEENKGICLTLSIFNVYVHHPNHIFKPSPSGY
ncbi:MAG: hypothetical protein DRJ34_02310 [Thermoprotei archaeon]|nr:MAG: hypothetical protein DRJ34_02310 [Thermoprotei archaeon]RLE73188.1 MAG: hypothetical protein DRJ45_00630 [Thermoprotei archaeon]